MKLNTQTTSLIVGLFCYLGLAQSPAMAKDLIPNEITIIYGMTKHVLKTPTSHREKKGKIYKEYALPEATGLRLELIASQTLNKETRCELILHGPKTLTANLTVQVPNAINMSSTTQYPRAGGTLGVSGKATGLAYIYAGTIGAYQGTLSLPMISSQIGAHKWVVMADPYFSTLFTKNTIEWTYLRNAGLEGGVERRTIIWSRYTGDIDATITHYYTRMLPEIQAGPEWLHSIAMVDYDYMSDEGKGWYNDIDALTESLSREDRGKVALSLHGWYDWVGEYAFNAKTKKLKKSWTAFGQQRPEPVFRSCTKQEMSIKEMHNRIEYAKSRGFRVVLYFADGVLVGSKTPLFNAAWSLSAGGWQGPDTHGVNHAMSPLVPDIRNFYKDYLAALLDEFGADIDAFVWDETYTIQKHMIGRGDYPGYADRALMTLVRELTLSVQKYNKVHNTSIAFLTSDSLGSWGTNQTAIVAHGTYQDAHLTPSSWQYGIHTNFRNSLWSCGWMMIRDWELLEFGVRNYQAPVAITNGFLDDTGFSELSPKWKKKVLDLFNWRKQFKTKFHTFTTAPPTLNTSRSSWDKPLSPSQRKRLREARTDKQLPPAEAGYYALRPYIPQKGEKNWALKSNNATATATSQYGAIYGPAGAVDGLNDTQWASENGKTFPQWIEIKFSETTEISTFVITSFYEHKWGIQNYEIQVWDTTSNEWSIIITEKKNRTECTRIHTLKKPSRTSRIRVVVTKGAPDNVARIIQFEAWGKNN